MMVPLFKGESLSLLYKEGQGWIVTPGKKSAIEDAFVEESPFGKGGHWVSMR